MPRPSHLDMNRGHFPDSRRLAAWSASGTATFLRRVLLLAGVALVLAGCGGHGTGGGTHASADDRSARHLSDGSYPCEATNVTKNDAPMQSTCVKQGNALTLQLPDGRSLDLEVASVEQDGDDAWAVKGTYRTTGDTWSLHIRE